MWGELTWRKLLGFVVLNIVIIAVLVTLSVVTSTVQKPNTEWPPIYAGTSEILVELGDDVLPSTANTPYKVISYKVKAKPEEVLSFYQDALTQEGWRDRGGWRRTTPNTLSFYYSGPEPCTRWYMLAVKAEETQRRETGVQLKINDGSCR